MIVSINDKNNDNNSNNMFARALRDRASAPTSLASAFKMPVAAVCVIHLMTSFPYVWDILLVAAIGLIYVIIRIT